MANFRPDFPKRTLKCYVNLFSLPMDFTYDLKTHTWTNTETTTGEFRILVLNYVIPIPNFYETWHTFVDTELKHPTQLERDAFHRLGPAPKSKYREIGFDFIDGIPCVNADDTNHSVFYCNILTGEWHYQASIHFSERHGVTNSIQDYILLRQHKDMMEMKAIFDHIRGSSRAMDEFMTLVRTVPQGKSEEVAAI